ncbi:MAG: kelch repeat-containing protein [Chthoniobacterales bacterium]
MTIGNKLVMTQEKSFMNTPLHPGCNWMRLWFGLAVLSWSFVTAAVATAQIPVITNPADLRFLNVNEAFDPLDAIPTWTAKAPMPTARAGFAISAASDATSEKIYVIGGQVVGSDECMTVQTVEAYNPATDNWTAHLAQPTAKRWRAAAGTLRGIIYLVGGASRADGVCGNVVSTVEAYDPVANSWSSKRRMRTARTLVNVAVDDVNNNGKNKLYAIGGATTDFTALKTVEVYDGRTGIWTRVADMQTARALPSVGVIGGKIYAVGGQTIGHIAIDTVEEYDPGTGIWTLHTSPNSHMPFPRLNAGAAVLDGKIYVVGGEDQDLLDRSGPSSTVQVYDPVSDTWTTSVDPGTSLVSMPTGRHFLGAPVVNNILYALGGEAPTATVGQQLTLQITATNNPTSYAASPLPAGLSVLDPALGIISGAPTVNGTTTSIFTATNGSGMSAPQDVSFSIKASPTPSPGLISIISSTCATARPGQPFAFQVLTDNANEEGAQLSASGFPYDQANNRPALTIDPGTGVISGTTPTDNSPQSFGMPVSLTDLTTHVTTQYLLQLTLVSDPSVPIIKSASATVVLNQYFSYTPMPDAPASSFNYIGLDGNLAGTLPPGLSFDSASGTISGAYSAQVQSGPETINIRPREPVQLIATNSTGTGTGTAPLNLIIGLHDFEVEALTTQLSGPGSPRYAIFTADPNTSGGAGGLLKEDAVGDSVTYTVPIAVAGNYDIKVGIKTNKGKGIFQLAIDGVNQGTPQDEYSSAMGYDVRDLGPHTFPNAGDSLFQFTVTDKNPSSIGYELVFDYIDLVPRSEAESLPAQATAPHSIVMEDCASGTFYYLLQATTAGDSVTYTVPTPVNSNGVVLTGTYDVKVGVKQRPDKGIFQLTIDGANQGYAQDEYSLTAGFHVRDLGTHTFGPNPTSSFQFTVTGKNPLSTKYTLAFDYIDLVLATALETETLTVSGNSDPYTYFPDPELSGGEGTLLEATASGDFISFTIPIAVAGVYDVKVGIRTNTDEGKFKLFINGATKAQGDSQDEYSAAVGYKVLDLGTVRFTDTGDKSFKFKVTGKNSASSGYHLAFDYIDLVRTKETQPLSPCFSP